MNQNTAQSNDTTNVQFSYPTFQDSQTQAQSPTGVTPQQSDEEQQIAKLKQTLGNLKEEDEKAKVISEDLSQPKQQEFSSPPSPSPAPSSSVSPQADVINTTTFIPEDVEFNALPSDVPVFKSSLDQVIPSAKKPKQPELDESPLIIEESQEQERENLTNGFDTNAKSNEGKNIPLEPDSEMESLLQEAVNRNASDLHIAVGYPPIIRIDGELMAVNDSILSPYETESLIFSILTDERKELLEVNREIDFAYTQQGTKASRFRVNAFYSMKNLSAAFRLIPPRIRTIEELFLPQIYHQFAKLKQGLVLVTGPTGHGKSTTLAAILEDINRTRFCHIVTIEDPVEYIFEGKKALIDQREMGDDTHSWNIALRSAMRQDPDVILVGEMRDLETIASAITLAETGHLVFATLHTNSASQTLDRIIDVFPENQQQQVKTQLATTLAAVIAQRLIPLDKGGRRAVSEIMLNNSAIKNIIREGKMHQIDNVIRTSADVGMVYLEKSLVGLVREGVISVQKAQEYAVNPEEVLRLLKA